LAAIALALLPISSWSAVTTVAATLPAQSPSITHGADVLVSGRSTLGQYDLYVASRSSDWHWKAIAALASPNPSDFAIGQQCVTGDGKYAVVVTAPRSATNDPATMDSGGLGYAVNLLTGRVSLLAGELSLAYFDPGCGIAEQYAVTGYSGGNESRTTVTVGDLASGAQVTETARGEYTSAVPVGHTAVAALGNRLEQLTPGGWRPDGAAFESVPYDVHPTSDGGVDLLVDHAGVSQALYVAAGRVLVLGSGRPGAAQIAGGSGGANILENIVAVAGTKDLTVIVPNSPRRDTVSLDGDALALPTTAVASHRAARSQVASVDEAEEIVTPGGAVTTRRFPTAAPVSRVAVATPAAGLDATGSQSTQTPTCAVPRGVSGLEGSPNTPDVQVPQPSGPMINWALTLAASNKLTGTKARPSGFDNLGLPSYATSSDFPEPALSGGKTATVPPQVMEGIFATESNWDQASYHAPRGMAGDPLIANYYGTDSNDDTIDYAAADCGYGVGQVTSLMTVGADPLATQEKIAVDYEENIAASEQILANFWNQLYADSITVNDANPATLEDWYLAIWAYNTGVHPNDGSGNYGLGWANNPINPVYPPDRPEFLSDCACDAATPNLWPYQERVFGWMDYPYSEGGTAFYQSATPAGQNLSIPPESTFCNSSDSCNPAAQPYCTLSSTLHCWWHESATWVSCSISGNCHREFQPVSLSSSEPHVSNPEPATCAADRSAVPSYGEIVDTQASATNWNLAGCPLNPTQWTSSGSFTVQFGQDGSGDPTGAIDWHQLGSGFGGHMWFTHPVGSSDPIHTDTGTWTPDLQTPGQQYDIKVFIPALGADDSDATYTIESNCGTPNATTGIDQSGYSDQWVDLGTYRMCAGSALSLSNNDSDIGSDLAFDAAAFVPENLTYQGANVLTQTHIYAIFWSPPSNPIPASYMTAVTDYLAHAKSGASYKNVLGQYYTTVGGQTYINPANITYVTDYVDTSTPPSSSCGANCIDDTESMDEIQTVGAPAMKNWPLRQYGSFALLFLPPNYSLCGPGGPFGIGETCSPPTGDYCAYHSYSTAVFQPNIDYGVILYPTAANTCLGGAGTGLSFSQTAEVAISSTSHELAEGITDPDVKGWCGNSGVYPVLGCLGETEIADKCEYLGSVVQTIAGNTYLLPQLWSNKQETCK